MLTISQYFIIGIAFLFSLLIHLLVIRFTHRSGIFLDEQDKVQKAHIMPTPRIGGLGIFMAALFVFYDREIGGLLVLSAIPAFVAGFVEDYSGKVSPMTRLAIMALSPLMAIVLVQDAGWVYLLGTGVPMVWSLGLMMVFIVAMINGLNFIDGQNGLAAGSALLTLAGLAYLSYTLHDGSLFFIAILLGLSVAAFLLFNFPFGRIFLGDGGAYFLGFLLAVLALLLPLRHPSLSPLVPLLLVIYPLWEVAFSACRKLFFERISPFASDDDHLHQLVYRNYGLSRPYLPALLLLPVQLLTLLFALLLADRPVLLLLLLPAFAGVYCFAYICQRKKDAARKAIMRVL